MKKQNLKGQKYNNFLISLAKRILLEAVNETNEQLPDAEFKKEFVKKVLSKVKSIKETNNKETK